MLEKWYCFMSNTVLYSKELTDKQKLLFWAISNLCAEKWYCRATNEHIWELLNADERTIRRNISALQEKWFINVSIKDKNIRHITLNESTDINVLGGRTNLSGGVGQKCPHNITIENKDISKDISTDICTDVSDLYKNYYWKNKWIDEKKCIKLIYEKLNQGISYQNIMKWMVLYNCECRLKQDFKFVKKFETRIKEFQALEEQQINEELYAIIKNFIEKRKTDDKFWQSSYAKTILNDLKQTFGEDKVKWMWKQANSIQLNFT